MSDTKGALVVKVTKEKKEVDSNDDKNGVRESLRSFLEMIVSMVIGDSKGVEVSYMVGDRTTVFQVKCPMDSLGRLIGRQGKTIDSIRTVIAATSACHNIRAVVEIPYRPPLKISAAAD